MGSPIEYAIPVIDAHKYPVNKVGGKSKNISLCYKENFRVPEGFAITTDSYFEFLTSNKLTEAIDKELVRKKTDEMRWEEIWDSALRIRHAFSKGTLPEDLENQFLEALSQWPEDTMFAVRSSSPDEDSKEFSFAGVHESYINVVGSKQVIEKIKLVWASLWSDRALLYRKEKGLNSATSSMAVLVQKMEHRDVSGLAFTMDPSNSDDEHIIVEAIKGTLNLLVDNKKAPERFKINKKSGELVESKKNYKTLTPDSINNLYNSALKLEDSFGEPVDIEWTGIQEEFTVLQVRPITVFKKDEDEDRQWYLTLTPSGQNLIDLAEKVESVLIPQLKLDGEMFVGKEPSSFGTQDLIEELKKRGEKYSQWTKIYWDDFIPFANGIRNFGSFYNDLVQPSDPYEFINLLKTGDLMAQKRDSHMANLADNLRKSPEVKNEVDALLKNDISGQELLNQMKQSGFKKEFQAFLNDEMDVSYDNTSLKSAPEVSLRVISSLSELAEKNLPENELDKDQRDLESLKEKYFKIAQEENNFEVAQQWLRIGQVSWRLRDDDNILLGKIENQLLVFIMEGLKRLREEGKIKSLPGTFDITKWQDVYKALKDGSDLELPQIDESQEEKTTDSSTPSKEKARQLVGQPSSPGVYTGKARIINSIEDFKGVEKGEILVFDSVQPQMTFIISLAGAIIERRGGMLVHSSIIAREMKIPAVNGVPKATSLIHTGDMVTVNGDMGIITIGKPEFEIEFL
jgi:pyruvate,water dikinase